MEVARREHPDLILIDLCMPEVDGFASALRIRKDEELKNVPIVAISAYGELGIDEQVLIDLEAIGFNESVPKPFGPEQLEKLLQRFIQQNTSAAGNEAD